MKLRRLVPNFYIHVSVSDLYILMMVHIFCCIVFVNRSWEYINRSQTHECGNWERGGAVSFLGIVVSPNFPYIAFAVCILYIRLLGCVILLFLVRQQWCPIIIGLCLFVSAPFLHSSILHTVQNIERVTYKAHTLKKHKRWAQFMYCMAFLRGVSLLDSCSFLYLFLINSFAFKFITQISPIFKSSTRLNWNLQSPNFLTLKEPRNRFQGIDAASLCTVAWRAGTTTLFLLGSKPQQIVSKFQHRATKQAVLQKSFVGLIWKRRFVTRCMYIYIQSSHDVPIFIFIFQFRIDFLSLDIEGAEMLVLQTIPWDKVYIQSILIEVTLTQSMLDEVS